jgi:uncharacterized SAM-binding protein YcdF (DUF218 family)|tara:strand:+ start:60 stop:749 length:690 start_codon:yes stop_codon:yes gene_type:complete
MKNFILQTFIFIPMPSLWLLFIYPLIGNKFIKKIIIINIFILLVVPSMPIASTILEKIFYNGLSKITIQDKKPAYVLVLGAGADDDGKYPTTESLRRAEFGIVLAREYSVPLIFSGGLDAELLPEFFDLDGLTYIKEVRSVNTFESALNLKKIVKFSDRPLLLVTNPMHYKRSILSLKKQGLDSKIPNNFNGNISNNYSFFPSAGSLGKFNNFIYEIVAITWYYFSGKI